MHVISNPKSRWSALPRLVIARLSDKNIPLMRYAFQVSLISAVPVMVVTSIAVMTGGLYLDPHRLIPNWRLGSPNLDVYVGLLDVIVLSPLIETGLTLLPIRLARRIRIPDSFIPAICGLAWGLIHANYHGTLQALIAAWPFYCFTTVLMAHEKPSVDRAWLIASAAHAFHNIMCLVVSAYLAGIR